MRFGGELLRATLMLIGGAMLFSCIDLEGFLWTNVFTSFALAAGTDIRKVPRYFHCCLQSVEAVSLHQWNMSAISLQADLSR